MLDRNSRVILLFLIAPVPALAQDPAAGEQAFRACRACHTIEQGGPHRVGPNLYGVYGQEAGAQEGYNYSQALQQAEIVWTEETLDPFLLNPREYLPGTKMIYAGLEDAQQRQDLIAYLKSNSPAAGQQ